MLRLMYLLARQRLKRRSTPPAPAPARPDRSRRWLLATVAMAVAGAAGIAIGLMYPRLVPPSGSFTPADSRTAELEIEVDSLGAPPLVVYLETPGASAPAVTTAPGHTAQITSVNNTFQPQFQVAPLATTLAVGNDDPIPHNTHLYDGRYTLFNVATPIPGLRVQKVLSRPGFYHVRCDLHPWMRAWIFVPPNRHYRVLWSAGRVTLAGIAPGRHRLHLWEPGRGEIARTLDFVPGETKSLALSQLHETTDGPRSRRHRARPAPGSRTR